MGNFLVKRTVNTVQPCFHQCFCFLCTSGWLVNCMYDTWVEKMYNLCIFPVEMGNAPVLLLAETVTPRLKYAVRLVFGTILRIPAGFTSDPVEFETYDGPKVFYGKKNRFHVFYIQSSGLLEESGIRDLTPGHAIIDGVPVLFPVDAGNIGFDVFAAAFYLVSRYEEYLPFQPDRHGRFPASSSILYRYGWIGRPLVNEWAIWLASELKAFYPGFSYEMPEYHFTPTIDVDNAFAYCHKGFVRNVGGAFRDILSHRSLLRRISCLSGREKDPYDTYEWIFQLHEEHGLTAKWFFLAGRYGKFDTNIAPSHPVMEQVIRKCAEHGQVGIHPSYNSFAKAERMKREKRALEKVLRQEVTISRQHFLRIRFPETFRSLIRVGIKEDYSLGYSTVPGFRAGICSPFPFYDLLREETTGLLLYPFVLMDRNFMQTEGSIAEGSSNIIRNLIREVFRVKGHLITIFHNEVFSPDEAGQQWRTIYQKLLTFALNPANDTVSEP